MKIKTDAEVFLANLLNEAHTEGLDLTDAEVDHLCFRTSSSDDYENTKKEFLLFSKMIAETEVNGRPIAAFKLNTPWQFTHHIIDLIEVPHPKKNKFTARAFEHFEVVIKISFDEFKQKYPQFSYVETGLTKKINPELEIELKNGAIKFHHMRLEKVVEIELRELNKY